MHLQLTKVRSGQSIKRYARLVQSYRRADGMPAQKVLANLGELDDQEVANMRTALAASRKGRAVVLSEPAARNWPVRVERNLAYLDIAFALEFWRRWELSELLTRLLGKTREQVSPADVIAALVLQRCVSPGSKLSAGRWFPRTALPELLGIEPTQFNNSRVHRVLGHLDRIDETLQEVLSQRVQHRDGAFAALFVDVTDAWFEGRGPDLARRGRTKEGLRNRHKIGILLLCNERGYPLRWKVLPGDLKDPPAMKALVGDLSGVKWTAAVPVVFDRAMGGRQAVAQLCASGLTYLTAARRPEIEGYTDQLPTGSLDDITPAHDADEKAEKHAQMLAATRLVAAGMQRASDTLLIQDFGICEREFAVDAADDDGGQVDAASLSGGAAWLHKARQFREQLDAKVFRTQSEIAKSLGISRARITQIMSLLRLDDGLQDDVLTGRYQPPPDHKLRKIAMMTGRAAQKRALDEQADAEAKTPAPKRKRKQKVSVKIRLVAYFNPQMFADQRITASRQRYRLESFIDDLNRRLRRGTRARDRESIVSEVDRKLGSLSMRSIAKTALSGDADTGWRVEIGFDDDAWAKRRRYDGFVLLLSDPGLGRSAREVVQLYRDKDAVERDFRTIKTDLKLRPVFHHSDPKVRAHVTLCMLSLLLERTMEQELRATGRRMTAPSALETLQPCHLNQLAAGPGDIPGYVATTPDDEQRALLQGLGMTHLIDPKELPDRLTPRANS